MFKICNNIRINSHHDFSYFKSTFILNNKNELDLGAQFNKQLIKVSKIDIFFDKQNIGFFGNILSKNLAKYIEKDSKKQHRCFHFAHSISYSKKYNDVEKNNKKFGDIIIFHKNNYDIHAAIYLGNNMLFSKIGKLGLYFNNFTQISEIYFENIKNFDYKVKRPHKIEFVDEKDVEQYKLD